MANGFVNNRSDCAPSVRRVAAVPVGQPARSFCVLSDFRSRADEQFGHSMTLNLRHFATITKRACQKEGSAKIFPMPCQITSGDLSPAWRPGRNTNRRRFQVSHSLTRFLCVFRRLWRDLLFIACQNRRRNSKVISSQFLIVCSVRNTNFLVTGFSNLNLNFCEE